MEFRPERGDIGRVSDTPTPDASDAERRPWRVFRIFLRLGLTSFGGPVAHLAYFRDEFVTRRRWLSEERYADLVALCQFLPGPASSQVGIALGLSRAGYAGALAAWAGFTLPSALLMLGLALGLARHGDALPAGVLHGLKVVAVAVVAQAVAGMARRLCPDAPRIALMLAAAGGVAVAPGAWAQVAVIAAAGLIGALALRTPETAPHEPPPVTPGRRAGVVWLALFAALAAGLPALAAAWPHPAVTLADSFYRAGALVFGGGHVVLPLLQAEVVATGRVAHETFLAGYGAAQSVPGPLFSFAVFLGASMKAAPTGLAGGLLALAALFAPAFLLVFGALPFWEHLRRAPRARGAMAGVNAAVVGLLLAALIHPVGTGAIHSLADVALAAAALLALTRFRAPAWAVVLGCAVAAGCLGAA